MRSLAAGLFAIAGLIACGGGTAEPATPTKSPAKASPAAPTAPTNSAPIAAPVARSTDDLVNKAVHRVDVIGADSEADAIRAVIATRVGQPFDLDRVARDIQAIWATGRVRTVHVKAGFAQTRRVAVTFRVELRPRVHGVAYQGNTQLSAAQLRTAGRLAPGSHLSAERLFATRASIVSMYANIGYVATVKSVTNMRPDKRVDVVFEVLEHHAVEVGAIRLVGVSKARAARLVRVLGEKDGSNTVGKRYTSPMLERGLLRVTAYYYDRGYVNAVVGQPMISHSTDKKTVTIRIEIKEGPQFRYGKLTVKGKLLAPAKTYVRMLRARSGQIFNRSQIGRALKRIQAFQKKKGQANPSVTPLTKIDLKTKTIQIAFDIE